jgi:hypothetical protein
MPIDAGHCTEPVEESVVSYLFRSAETDSSTSLGMTIGEGSPSRGTIAYNPLALILNRLQKLFDRDEVKSLILERFDELR